jgi:hypothetical protein
MVLLLSCDCCSASVRLCQIHCRRPVKSAVACSGSNRARQETGPEPIQTLRGGILIQALGISGRRSASVQPGQIVPDRHDLLLRAPAPTANGGRKQARIGELVPSSSRPRISHSRLLFARCLLPAGISSCRNLSGHARTVVPRSAAVRIPMPESPLPLTAYHCTLTDLAMHACLCILRR